MFLILDNYKYLKKSLLAYQKIDNSFLNRVQRLKDTQFNITDEIFSIDTTFFIGEIPFIIFFLFYLLYSYLLLYLFRKKKGSLFKIHI